MRMLLAIAGALCAVLAGPAGASILPLGAATTDGTMTYSGTRGLRTKTDMLWASTTFTFTASTTLTELSLSALLPGGLPPSFNASNVFSGPALDNFDMRLQGGGGPNLLVNGSLESALPPDQFNLVTASPTHNSNALPGWTIVSGSVDIVPTSYWQSSNGQYSVDLIGSPGLGTITQDVVTVPGTTYQLTFDFSINPENLTAEGGSTKFLNVSALPLGSGQGVPEPASLGLLGTAAWMMLLSRRRVGPKDKN